MRRPVLFAAVPALLLALAAPTGASCLTPTTLRSFDGVDEAGRSFIWTATRFEPLYFESYAPLGYVTPFTPSLSGSFWALGAGDPAIGIGDDSGALNVIDALGFDTNSTYGVYYAAELDADWSDPLVDGCIAPNACACLLLTDGDPAGPVGFFASIGAAADGFGDTLVNLAGSDPLGHGSPIVLREIPRPTVTAVDRPQSDTVEVTVTVPGRSAAIYEGVNGGSCACGPTGFLIYRRVVPRFSVPPLGRDFGSWTLAPLVSGGAQPITPTDGSVSVAATCPGGDSDVYLATQLFFDSGFATQLLSANSVAIECGDNLSGPLERIRTGPQRPRGGKQR